MHCRPDSNEDLHSLARLAEALTVKVSCLFYWEEKRKEEENCTGQELTKKGKSEIKTKLGFLLVLLNDIPVLNFSPFCQFVTKQLAFSCFT